MSERDADRAFRDGQYDVAIQKLEEGLKKNEGGLDELLYLLDLGLIHHTAGNYKESNKYFLRADQIAEIKDYTDAGKEAESLLTSQNRVQYKGEDFEKVLINTYLSINFALLENYEDALVEARRVNRKLYRMITEGGKKYQQSAFARYLSAILYEGQKEYNDARISYHKAFELDPEIENIKLDLWRTSKILGNRQEAEEWEKKFSLVKDDFDRAMKYRPSKDNSELIVIFQNGLSPIKQPNPSFNRVPHFVPRANPVETAAIKVDGKEIGQTEILEDIEATAIHNLELKYGGLVAKRIAGYVVKEAAAAGIEKATDSPLLGLLTRVALHASDQADLRSWQLLPRDLQMLRIPLSPGTYQIEVIPVGQETLGTRAVTLAPGEKKFISYRYLPD